MDNETAARCALRDDASLAEQGWGRASVLRLRFGLAQGLPTPSARILPTSSRLLAPGAISLAERLLATLGPASRLDTVFFVNSGSEANDLAWRMACAFTGNAGGLCTHWCGGGRGRLSLLFLLLLRAAPGTLPVLAGTC